ncbi:hypothetical protein KEM56_001958 [Ascosphaera pollenicola]|nr:hypothetical protein KEM56_001958 [Ascosphaera pollenicola]
MAAGDEYSAGGGGRLKIKGVQDGRVGKKKTKKGSKKSTSSKEQGKGKGKETKQEPDHEKEEVVEKEAGKKDATMKDGGEGGEDKNNAESLSPSPPPKTKAEIEYEERRKKRLLHRLKREGIKTHKEQVEELNKYLSTLSEHHDMPKIGPG